MIVAMIAPVLSQENQSEQKAQAPQVEEAQKQPTNPPISVIVTNPLRIDREQAVEPDWEKPKCRNPQNHDEADLCEQRRMAKAAEDSIFLSRVQIGLGVLGFFALLATIYYSRKATEAATVAAEAALNSVHIAQDTAKRQLRAYLTPKHCILRYEHGEPVALVAIVNSGTTPAERATAVAALRIVDKPTTFLIASFEAAQSKGRVRPEGIMELEARRRDALTRTEIDGLRTGTHTLVVVGDIEYMDIFERVWTQHFEFATGGIYGPAVESGPMAASTKDFRERQKT